MQSHVGTRFDYGIRMQQRQVCAVPGCTEPVAAGWPGLGFWPVIPLCEKHNHCPRCTKPIRGMRRAGASGLAADCCGTWEPAIIREAWRVPWLLWMRGRWLEPGRRIRQVRVVHLHRTLASGLPLPGDD